MDIEEKIQKMLQDTCKGLATKDELKTAVAEETAKFFEEQRAKVAEIETEARTAVAELQAANQSLEQQVKNLMRTRFAAVKTPDGMYNGIWGNLETAKNFGLFVIAEITKCASAKEQFDALGIEKRYITADGKIQKAMSGDITAGGAAIPTEFIPQLIVLLENFGVYRVDAQEWPMASDSSVAAVQTGDVVVYAPGAGNEPTESSPGFKNIGLNARKMMTLTAIDSDRPADHLADGRSIARAFAKKEDQCGFIGDGTSTYFNFIGIVNALLNVDISDVTNIMALHVQATAGDWSKIDRADLLALPGIIMDEADSDGDNCKWYSHRNFYYTVMINIALGLGGTNVTEVTQTGWTKQPRFLQRPVRFANVLPRVKPAADHIPVILGNLKLGSLLGDRRALTIDQSREAYFKTDQL